MRDFTPVKHIPVTTRPGTNRRDPRSPRLPEWARKSRTHFESLNRLKSRTARAQSAYGLRIGALPQYPRMLPSRRRHLHDSRQSTARAAAASARCPKANPRKQDMRLDPAEPANVARMAAGMKLRYVVITSVNRDDLADGGSQHFAETVREVRRALPEARVEVLTPDFCGDLGCRGARAGCRSARLQSQHGDRAAPLPPRAPAGRLPAVARRAGFRAPPCAAHPDEVRLHGGAGRN